MISRCWFIYQTFILDWIFYHDTFRCCRGWLWVRIRWSFFNGLGVCFFRLMGGMDRCFRVFLRNEFFLMFMNGFFIVLFIVLFDGDFGFSRWFSWIVCRWEVRVWISILGRLCQYENLIFKGYGMDLRGFCSFFFVRLFVTLGAELY